MRHCLKMFFAVAVMLLALAACKKDDDGIATQGDCVQIEGFNGYTKISRGGQFYMPVFNPINPSEFVYLYQNSNTSIYLLIKHNMLTREQTILENRAAGIDQLKWGKSGWITFNQSGTLNSFVYIIKDNGDSLKYITPDGGGGYPVFNNLGNEVIWNQTSSNILRKGIYEETANILASDANIVYSDVSINNDWLGLKRSYSVEFNYGSLNDSIFTLSKIPFDNTAFGSSKIGGLCWDHDGTHFYFTVFNTSDATKRGLYRCGLDGNCEKLIGFCDSKIYKSISCSPDGRFLIADRLDSYLDEIGIVYQVSTIWLINLTTLEEKRVELY